VRTSREHRLERSLLALIVTDLADVDICDITPAPMKHTLAQLDGLTVHAV
jgi:hypothetical protein